jgi:hypothetical protein
MQANVMFVDCPAYMDEDGAVRCGLPAAVEYWGTVESSSGPLENAKIRCPRGHGFNGPVEFLTVTSGDQPVRGNPVHDPASRAEERAPKNPGQDGARPWPRSRSEDPGGPRPGFRAGSTESL